MEKQLCKENEEVLFRFQKRTFYGPEEIVISQDLYNLMVGSQVVGAYYKTETILLYKRTDKPGKIYVRKCLLTKRQVHNPRGFYCGKKTREIETVIFDLKYNNFLFIQATFKKRKWTSKFKTNYMAENGQTFFVHMRNIIDKADKLVLFTTLCQQLGITYKYIEQLAKKYNLDYFLAVTSLFLLERRGMDIQSVIDDACPNFEIPQILKHLKLIQPGMTLNQLILQLFPVDTENLELLRTDPHFANVFLEPNRVTVKGMMDALKVQPEDLLPHRTQWGRMETFNEHYTSFQVLAHHGVSYKVLREHDLNELDTMAYLLNYFDLLGLKLRLDKVLHISRHKAEFDVLKSFIQQALSENSHFLPNNKAFARKLTNKEFTFEPMYHYGTVNNKNHKHDLYAPYRVIHKDEGVIGVVLFSKMENKNYSRIIWREGERDYQTRLQDHILYKVSKTKLMEYLDYSIRFNKKHFKELLDEKLSDQFKNLLVWE